MDNDSRLVINQCIKKNKHAEENVRNYIYFTKDTHIRSFLHEVGSWAFPKQKYAHCCIEKNDKGVTATYTYKNLFTLKETFVYGHYYVQQLNSSGAYSDYSKKYFKKNFITI